MLLFDNLYGRLRQHPLRGAAAVGQPAVVASQGRPVVAVDEKQSDDLPPSVDFVSIDHRKSIRVAVDHLAGLGHQCISYIADGQSTTYSRRSKSEGFLEAAAANGLTQCHIVMPPEPSERPQFSGKELAELGRRAVATIMESYPETTAIVTFNDMTALGAVEALKDLQVSVLDRMSVVGIDGISVSELLTPSITSVRQPLEISAKEAVKCVAEQLGGRRIRKDIYVQPELIVRRSSGRRQ
ncbi:substrate-binding domain-containing protein [Rhizobium sp. R693]|uniref:LacI family DNA-binding transcriptional regulator n=1 Tax=Rhizobium sp. R693 TaxID=1764276 RepID=UPI000B5357D9|nr:substrate-binding domain-containing protein [Rhizobium sp. R693]OWV98806.1 hypothetical protein ATY79_19290 [Rhizobium sp. R693]